MAVFSVRYFPTVISDGLGKRILTFSTNYVKIIKSQKNILEDGEPEKAGAIYRAKSPERKLTSRISNDIRVWEPSFKTWMRVLLLSFFPVYSYILSVKELQNTGEGGIWQTHGKLDLQ